MCKTFSYCMSWVRDYMDTVAAQPGSSFQVGAPVFQLLWYWLLKALSYLLQKIALNHLD
jgi:hypothetical protein